MYGIDKKWVLDYEYMKNTEKHIARLKKKYEGIDV